MEVSPSLRHKLFRGKWSVRLKVPLASHLNDYYTPGVAEPCKAIATDSDMVWEYTNRANVVAVVSNGSRILGLGNIGPEAGLPVMEGKAVLYKYYAGIDAIPLCIKAHSTEEILAVLKALEPSLGGINLEDISQPTAYHVLCGAREQLEIPVIHDDMEGTGIIILGALLSAVRQLGLDLSKEKIVLMGAGSANMGFLQLLKQLLQDIGRVVVVDVEGAFHSGNCTNHWMPHLLAETNSLHETNLEQALSGASILVCASRPGPGVFPLEFIRKMKKPRVVLSLANPIPEVSRTEADYCDVDLYASGRSDDPNQVNNSLVFPGLMLGLLISRRQYSLDIGIEVAQAISKEAAKMNRLVPPMNSRIHSVVASAVLGHFSNDTAPETAKEWFSELRHRMEAMV